MKAKFKFDTAIIKNFFADHVEKIVAGICVIVMLFLISTIFKRETLPSNLQPPQIATKTTNVRNAIETDRPDRAVADLKPIEVPGAVAEVPVNELAEIPAFVRSGGPLSDPVKRTDPTYFPVLAPQVKSFVLAMATNAASGTTASPVAPVAPAISRLPGASRAPVPDTKPGAAAAPTAPTRRGRTQRPGAETAPAPGLPGNRGGIGTDAAANPDNVMQIPAAMPVPGAPNSGAAEVRPFNIITAAIPVENQQKEYDRRYSHARRADLEVDPRNRAAQQQMTDVPQYIWWRLERIDLTNGSEKTVIDYGDVAAIVNDRRSETIGADLVMKTLKPTGKFVKLNNDVLQWGGTGAEVVPSAYHADTWLTWPLPPMLLHDWGREATHPKIPLVEPKTDETPDGANPAEPGKSKSKDNDNPFDDKSLGADATQSPTPRATAQPSFMNGRGRDFSRRNPRGMGFGQGNPRGGFVPGAQQPQNPDAPQVPYKLFRFTDFDVEPGHTYQYRIQLVLRNPNFGQPPELLAKPQPKPLPYADTPWSEMSPPSTVPALSKVIVETVERPKKGEPKAKAGVLAWIKKDTSGNPTGVELLAKSELNLGDVANFIQKKILAAIDPVNRNVHDFTADFVSNAALVDMHGGGDEKTSPDGGGQGELLVLVVGRNGAPDQLAVVNQAVDKFALDAWTKTHIVPKEILDAEAEANGPVRSGLGTGGLIGRPTPSTTRPTTPTRGGR